MLPAAPGNPTNALLRWTWGSAVLGIFNQLPRGGCPAKLAGNGIINYGKLS